MFDLDWFDIETKARQMMQDLMHPTVTRVHKHKDEVNQVNKALSAVLIKVERLENAVFEKNQKIDAFEKIELKIA